MKYLNLSLKRTLLFIAIFILIKYIMEGNNQNFLAFLNKNSLFCIVLFAAIFLANFITYYLNNKK